MPKTHTLTLFADYFQLFIYDASLNWDTVDIGSDWWTEQDYKQMLSIKENGRLLVMGTFRNFNVPLEVAVFNEVPAIPPLTEWDQVVECSLKTESSNVVIGELANQGENGLLVEGSQTQWRVRLYYGGQATIDKMGIGGHDYYRIELWPANSAKKIKTIKQRILD